MIKPITKSQEYQQGKADFIAGKAYANTNHEESSAFYDYERGYHELALQQARQPIRIWDFRDAPKDLKALSDNGGDEDWLALVPPCYRDRDPLWLSSEQFGCSGVQVIERPNGFKVYIGSHS